MKLTVVWHERCWPSPHSPTGYASRGCLGHPGFGGLPRQVEALSELFDATRIVGPCSESGNWLGETPVDGKNVTLVPLTWLPRSPWLTWLLLPFWLARNGVTLAREVARADAVFPLIPSPIGFLGLILALILRKPLLTRQLNGWAEPRLLWRLQRACLERIAGGRNVVFATGSSKARPSSRNPAIRWILSTTVSQQDVGAYAAPRGRAPGRHVRLMLMGGEVDLEETWTVLSAIPLLANALRNVTLDVVGGGADLARLRQVAGDMNLTDRVTFHGSVSRKRALELLARADVFCCLPTAETEGFRQAVVEALACGLPVVTTRTSISSMLMSEGCGTIMHERTPEALAAAVKVCLTDHSRYRSMSARALHMAQACSLERWRDMIQVTLEAAWGPLRSKPAEIGV
jgi:hypothetical protein